TSDVSGDYFHPSVAGQAKLASVSWTAGYTWQTGTPTPTPTPTLAPTPTPTPTPSPTPTVTPTPTPTPPPTPTPVPAASIFVSDLDGFGTSVNRNFWRANVTATVLNTDGGPVASATVTGQFGTSSKTCVTGLSGTCTLTS